MPLRITRETREQEKQGFFCLACIFFSFFGTGKTTYLCCRQPRFQGPLAPLFKKGERTLGIGLCCKAIVVTLLLLTFFHDN